MHVPELIKKHTHVRTIYKHHYIPKKSSHHKRPHRGHSRIDPTTIGGHDVEHLPIISGGKGWEPTVPYEMLLKNLNMNQIKNWNKNVEKLGRNNRLKMHNLKKNMPLSLKGFSKGYKVTDDEIHHGEDIPHYNVQQKSPLHTSFQGPDYIQMTEHDHVEPQKYNTNWGFSSPQQQHYEQHQHHHNDDDDDDGDDESNDDGDDGSDHDHETAMSQHFQQQQTVNNWPISSPDILNHYSTLPDMTEIEKMANIQRLNLNGMMRDSRSTDNDPFFKTTTTLNRQPGIEYYRAPPKILRKSMIRI